MFARNMNEFRDYRGDKIETAKPMSEEALKERIEHMQNIVFPALKEKVEVYNQAMKEKFDATHKIIDFPEKSHVMVRVQSRGSKLAPAYEGPYTVLRKTQGGTYVLQDETGALMSRNYVPSELKLISQDDVVPIDELYEVEAILNHRGQPGKRQYLVRWKGYGEDEDSWLDPDAFTDPDFILQYWKRRNEQEEDAPATLIPKKRVPKRKLHNPQPKRRSKRIKRSSA
ncbi:hypothetical protein O0I10_012926 [Lichtheimia ornata]|uniref:Chromo domain-containing protein n=1 Tax=Lichtheimia ornata TaxID=688661 RepID=A0AAD7UQE8_9FUNG|nr:uncharacterized protein O0I10_012926 [Lichtheimia ornata]KAJ8651513.1 hypothetical protein O0I10_012926 [Lichtheimia ornata]